MPSAPIASPLVVEPIEATATTVSPRMASAKYSAGPTASPALATGPAANIRTSTPKMPATIEPPADRPMATMALPCCAIG